MTAQPTRRGMLRTGLTAGLAAGALATPIGRAAAAPRTNPHRTTGGNLFLEGPFAPVEGETTSFDLTITGKLPDDLDGRLLRTGPNPFGIEDPTALHWMMGEGMVHGVRLRDGKADWYRSRWVRSQGVAEKLGEPVRGKPADRDFASNINVIGFRGRTLALQEGAARPQELTDELYTVGPCDFGGTWPGTMSAHTKCDPRTGELHSVSYDESRTWVQYMVVGTDGTVTHTRRIEMGAAVLMHDFALTETHVVLYDAPIVFDLSVLGKGHKIPWRWDAKRPCRVGWFRRDGGPVTWVEIAPTYPSHTLNAYDHGHKIVVDFTVFPAPFDADALTAPGPPVLGRWVIDTHAKRVRADILDDRPQEFPRVADADVTRRHRFGYTAATRDFVRIYTRENQLPDSAFANGIVKHDFVRGTSELHRLPRHANASEAVFVPRRGGRGGDDGYVLAYVHNPDRNASDVVVLSAQDFTGRPLARVQLPARIPLGLHGSWVATAD